MFDASASTDDMRKDLTMFGDCPVPEPFTPEELALASRLARELFSRAAVPKHDWSPPLWSSVSENVASLQPQTADSPETDQNM